MPISCKAYVVTGDMISDEFHPVPHYTLLPLAPAPPPEPRAPAPLKFGKRCVICRRKIPLAGVYPCRCGVAELCSAHRPALEHACAVRYRDLYERGPRIGPSKVAAI